MTYLEQTERSRTQGVHRLARGCRACGGGDMTRFLSLGPQPLANAFLRSPSEFADEPSYPLDVWFCRGCSLVQLRDVIDPAELFSNYLYVSGTSETMAAHHRAFASWAVRELDLAPADLVVELASNDGSLLQCFRRLGLTTVGVEPAANIAARAEAAGIRTINRFFDEAVAEDVRGEFGPARLVVANNVLAHVDAARQFLRGAGRLVEPDGIVSVEVPYLKEMIGQLEYDTVYHEHLCYFSVTSMLRLSEEADLSIFRVTPVDVHGGSLRVLLRPRSRHAAHARDVVQLADQEQQHGLRSLDAMRAFARRVGRHRDRLRGLLGELQAAGKTVAGYGAPAKGNTLLNYCGIGPRLLPYTVDKSPLKIGRYTPGMHIPVLSPEVLQQRQPDYVLILAWNYADEIMRQQREYRRRGGRFIIPIPEPRIV